jgi:hypothetical protein
MRPARTASLSGRSVPAPGAWYPPPMDAEPPVVYAPLPAYGDPAAAFVGGVVGGIISGAIAPRRYYGRRW